MHKIFLFMGCLFCFTKVGFTQVNTTTPDHVYLDNIKTVKLAPVDNPLKLPIINLNSSQKLLLSFDDLDERVKDYSYTLVLCNADWTPVNISPFNYIDGFKENRIRNYHYSTLPLQKYIHYQVRIPNRDIKPKLSGNYLLKVYVNEEEKKLAFTKRLMVTQNKAIVHGEVKQPTNPKVFKRYQRIDFDVNLQGLFVNNPLSQVKVFILQNGRWDNAIKNLKPTFIRGDKLVYNTEDQSIFPAMKEWRWADLRSFRLQTERVKGIVNSQKSIDVFLKTDFNRSQRPYSYRKDINGHFIPDIMESGYNPNYEGEYAKVHFYFSTPHPFPDSKVYVFGEMTNYECSKKNVMTYNPTKKVYETTLYLKQGYYNYIYGIIPDGTHQLLLKSIEGNWWEAKNNYTILVYYRPLGKRADRLIGIRSISTMEKL